MELVLSYSCRHPTSYVGQAGGFECYCWTNYPSKCKISFMTRWYSGIYARQPPKNCRYPRREKLPPDLDNTFLRKKTDPLTDSIPSENYETFDVSVRDENSKEERKEKTDGEAISSVVWEEDEIDAITSLFERKIPQKLGKLHRNRPLPLPIPYKIRPLELPKPKKHPRVASSDFAGFARVSLSKQLYKNPSFLVQLAREIRSLSPEEDLSSLLNKSAQFLRKGSLSLTIRELGHMGLPDRALQVFCWAQKQHHLFPDDRILASTVEVLERAHTLKMPFNLERFACLASQGVYEAAIKGFTKAGNLRLAWKLLSLARFDKRKLDAGIYAKLIIEFGKNPDTYPIVMELLDDLAKMENLNLAHQDCTAIMKVCVRLGRYDIVEGLYGWFKQTGLDPGLVMYTTLVHSRYSEKKYREAVAVVWEMEALDCILDLPAYRVIIKVFVALNDLPRTVRYFSKLKEAGFSPTYDIYRGMIEIYMVSGRLIKFKEVCAEAKTAGFKLDTETRLRLLEFEA